MSEMVFHSMLHLCYFMYLLFYVNGPAFPLTTLSLSPFYIG